MTIVDTYSSWTRNRLTADVRAAIRDAGEGRCWFGPALGQPRGWVGCTVVVGNARAWAVGPDPASAFGAALDTVRTPIVSLLDGIA